MLPEKVSEMNNDQVLLGPDVKIRPKSVAGSTQDAK